MKRKQEMFAQHTPDSISKWLDGVFTYSQVKSGNLNKNEGDVVIVNLKPACDGLPDIYTYLDHTHYLDRVETVGVFTNVYWSKKYFAEGLEVALYKGLRIGLCNL